jgi:hypothetical protein
MSTLYKEGVCGMLNRQMRKCKGRLAILHRTRGEDFVITSMQEGKHRDDSLHPQGDGLDFRYKENVSRQEVIDTCGKGFDVVFESDHIHTEYDPK